MSILMNGESCMSCACSHFTSAEKSVLWCVQLDMHPRGHDHCKYYEKQDSEKLVLTRQFVEVLQLLRKDMKPQEDRPGNRSTRSL